MQVQHGNYATFLAVVVDMAIEGTLSFSQCALRAVSLSSCVISVLNALIRSFSFSRSQCTCLWVLVDSLGLDLPLFVFLVTGDDMKPVALHGNHPGNTSGCMTAMLRLSRSPQPGKMCNSYGSLGA